MPEFRASFRVMRTDLESAEVSNLLNLTPHHCHQRGDPRISRSGKRFSDFTEGLWELRAALDLSESLTTHLTVLANTLHERKAALVRLRELGYEMDIFVGVFDEGGNTTFTLESEVMRTLSRLGLEIVFDVYP